MSDDYDPADDARKSYDVAIEAKRLRGDTHWPASLSSSAALVRYELPFPPSVNNLFANGARGGRYRTERYARWAETAGGEILAQGRKRVRGHVSVSIALVRPDKRKRDASNAIKAVEDLLVSMAVIEDDSLVQRVSAEWVGSGAPCTVLIQEAQEVLAA